MSIAAETLAFLREVRLFKGINGAELTALGESMHDRSLKRGHILCREGDPGDEMFVVRRGTFVISKPVTGRVEQVLARIGPGEFFGEMSLFAHAPRSATVQADTDATVLVLDRASLTSMTEQSPRAAAALFYAMVQVFIERLRASGDLVAEVTRWGLEATGLDVDAR